MSKRKRRKKRQKKTTKERPTWVVVGVVLLAAAVLIALVWQALPQFSSAVPDSVPVFQKEGTLGFLRNGSSIVQIDIEVANTDAERTQGLMHRRDMQELEGMLFIFEQSEPRSFWMENTYISLDIFFVDENKRIVNVQSNTTPMSRVPIVSSTPAQYVVEVLAGFARKYNLRIGDTIEFALEEN